MVTITNGIVTTSVTRGAYEMLFRDAGYSIVGSEEKREEMNSNDEQINITVANDDEVFVSDLMEKPISEWNKNEVKKFASIKGVDIGGTKSVNEAKELIKAFLEEEGE